MKILHVAAYNNLYFNGVYSVLAELTREQQALGHEVKILNIDNNEGTPLPIEQCAGTQHDFDQLIGTYLPDIVVLHGIYKPCYIGYVRTLKRHRVPYLVEPHGGTSRRNAKKKPLKKLIGKLLIGNQLISNAQAVIYLNQHEADNCVYQRQRKNYVIIPNGTVPFPLKPSCNTNYPLRFIFLARIDIDDKALDILFPAIRQFNADGMKAKAEFHFYGKARMPEYKAAFDHYIATADDNVFYHGPAFGDDKVQAYQQADIFILTSRSEGMPMSVLEALASGLPCLLTRQTNMADLISQHHCGWVTPLSADAITATLKQAVNDYPTHAATLSANAREAVADYTWPAIAQNSIAAYQRFACLK